MHSVRTGPSILVQILWFFFLGWWMSLAWAAIAGVLSTLIITLPISITMLNKMPQIVALREPKKSLIVVGGALMEVKIPQHSFILRAIYFLLIGFWLTWIWIAASWFLCVIIIGMPLGFMMFDLTPSIQTLRKRAPNSMIAPTVSQQQGQSMSVNVNVQNIVAQNDGKDRSIRPPPDDEVVVTLHPPLSPLPGIRSR